MLAEGRLRAVLRDGAAVLRSAADDGATAGRCARLLERLRPMAAATLEEDAVGGHLPELVGAGVALLQRGWDGSGWEGGSEAAAGGAELLAGVVAAADDDVLSRQAGEATAPLCSLLAAEAEAVATGGCLSADGHTALTLLYLTVVCAANAAAAEQAAGAGAAAALLQLLSREPGREEEPAAMAEDEARAIRGQALAVLGALAGREAGARAILNARGGLERLAACVHDGAMAEAAAGVLAALASRFPAELAQVGRPPCPLSTHIAVGKGALPCWPSPAPMWWGLQAMCASMQPLSEHGGGWSMWV